MSGCKRFKRAVRLPFEWAGIWLALAIFGSMPRRVVLAVADFASAVMYLFDAKGRAHALKNLRIIEASGSARRIERPAVATRGERLIIRRAYRNMARTIAHAFWTFRDAKKRAAAAGEMSEEGRAFLARNKTAVTVSGHIGCWEILSQLAYLEGHRMMSVAKDIGTGAMTKLLMKSRRSIGQEIVHAEGAFRPLMKGVKDGKSLGLLVDQAVRPSDGGIWVSFFGRPVPVSAAPAFFSAKGKAPIAVAWSRPLKDGRYRCEVVAEYSPSDARDVWGMTQRCIWDLERVIRRHPSCWALNYNAFRKHPTAEELAALRERLAGMGGGEHLLLPFDRPLKTLQLVPAMEQGGVERGVVEVNRALVAAGWENVVVSAGGRLAARLARDGARHITLDVKSKNPLTYFSRAAKLRKVLIAENPDVVCAHSRVPAWLFLRAAKGLDMPWITFAHGANSISPYSRVMTRGDLTVTPSRYIADYLKAAYGIKEARLRVIPRAIDRDRFDVAKVDPAQTAALREEWGVAGRKVVMGVGRITQLKGYDILIRAVASLPERFMLVLVGEAEALRKDVEEALRALVKELGVGARVVFAGNRQNIAECLSVADVVVSSNVRKAEAFGRSMAEALAMDRPVVAKAFGGALDIVEPGKNGELVENGTPEEFAAAIAKAVDSDYGDIRSAALEKFSFERMIASSLAVYREVVEKLKG